jgi:hypothetical protein
MKNPLSTALLLGIMASAALLSPISCSAAEAAGTGPQFNLQISLAENLTVLQGKTVTVTLSSGQAVSGIVKDVKNGLLHLEKLSQKDFFDAIIVLDKVAAVEARVR